MVFLVNPPAGTPCSVLNTGTYGMFHRRAAVPADAAVTGILQAAIARFDDLAPGQATPAGMPAAGAA